MQIYSGDGLKFRYRGNNSFFSISVFQSTASTAVVSAAVPDFLVTGSVCFVVHINVFKKPITVHSRPRTGSIIWMGGRGWKAGSRLEQHRTNGQSDVVVALFGYKDSCKSWDGYGDTLPKFGVLRRLILITTRQYIRFNKEVIERFWRLKRHHFQLSHLSLSAGHGYEISLQLSH